MELVNSVRNVDSVLPLWSILDLSSLRLVLWNDDAVLFAMLFVMNDLDLLNLFGFLNVWDVHAVLFARLKRLMDDLTVIFVREVVPPELDDIGPEVAVKDRCNVDIDFNGLGVDAILVLRVALVNFKDRLFLLVRLAGKFRHREGVFHNAEDVFCPEAPAEKAPPALHLNILELDVGAHISLIAANDSRRQQAAIRLHVLESDIMKADEGLGLTRSERIKHATRATATRLPLLLGANVDGPPKSAVNNDVLIVDIGDAAA